MDPILLLKASFSMMWKMITGTITGLWEFFKASFHFLHALFGGTWIGWLNRMVTTARGLTHIFAVPLYPMDVFIPAPVLASDVVNNGWNWSPPANTGGGIGNGVKPGRFLGMMKGGKNTVNAIAGGNRPSDSSYRGDKAAAGGSTDDDEWRQLREIYPPNGEVL